MDKKFWKILAAIVSIVCFAALGTAFAQKKVGGGDIKYEAKGSAGPVLFSHETHQNTHKLKCTDCHTKIFKMKKETKMTKATHSESKYCGVCHDGKKAFSQTVEADCAKCHKS